MTRILFAIYFLGLLPACGHHDSESTFFQKSGEEKVGEKLTDPLEIMEAAIFDSDTLKIQNLLDQGFDINTVLPQSGRTPLAEAVFKEKLGIIRFLRKKGSDMELALIDGQTVLEWVQGQADGKKHLLRALTKTESEDRQELFTALNEGQLDILKGLFREGVSPNLFSEDGETPLTQSIQQKNLKTIRVLFSERSLDVDLKNKTGESPLLLARRHDLKSVVNELVKRKARE